MAPDCDARLVWNGVTYSSAGSPSKPLLLGRQLGSGVIPDCAEDAPVRKVEVVGIRGVRPSVAVAVLGEGEPPYAWLAPGYLPEHPRHPLHDAIYAPGEPDAEAGFLCGPERTVRARAVTTPSVGYLQVSAEEDRVQDFLLREDVEGIVTLDSDTVVTGFERDGIPFVQAGDRFTLTLRECKGKSTEPGLTGLRRLVVDEIAP